MTGAARAFLVLGAIYGASGVLLGALAAHALPDRLPAERLASFETGVRYQVIHALFLLVLALAVRQGVPGVQAAGWLAAGGAFLFSGSIYLLCFRASLPFAVGWLGPVTPIGGLLLIAAWISLLIPAFRTAPGLVE